MADSATQPNHFPPSLQSPSIQLALGLQSNRMVVKVGEICACQPTLAKPASHPSSAPDLQLGINGFGRIGRLVSITIRRRPFCVHEWT
jgi:hypothetical protein